MPNGRICVRMLMLVPVLAIAAPAGTVAQNAEPSADAADARKAWERVIAAKGGRERLREIRNFVVISELKPTGFSRPEVAAREYLEFLVVLPNRLWQFHG